MEIRETHFSLEGSFLNTSGAIHSGCNLKSKVLNAKTEVIDNTNKVEIQVTKMHAIQNSWFTQNLISTHD